MRILTIALWTALLPGCATRAPSEADIVAYAKGLPVTAIDPDLLASQTLGEWITARAQDGRVAWESNDCGEQTGDPTTTPSDFPICAEAQFTTCTGLSASVSVVVGTLLAGINGLPELNWAQPGGVRDTDTLSSLGQQAPICSDAPNNSFEPKPLRAPNNSFKPNLPSYIKGVAQEACHAFASTRQVGSIQVGRHFDYRGGTYGYPRRQ